LAVFEGRDMRRYAPVMTFKIVLDRAVLGIRHHDLYLALSILSMLLKQIGKQMALINRPGSHLGRGYDFAFTIHGPVNFEGKLGAHFALTDQGGIRVGGGKVSPVELALTFAVFGQFLQPGLQFLIVPVELAFKGVQSYDGIV
jgi:hypothetical protein